MLVVKSIMGTYILAQSIVTLEREYVHQLENSLILTGLWN